MFKIPPQKLQATELISKLWAPTYGAFTTRIEDPSNQSWLQVKKNKTKNHTVSNDSNDNVANFLLNLKNNKKVNSNNLKLN